MPPPENDPKRPVKIVGVSLNFSPESLSASAFADRAIALQVNIENDV